MKHMLLAVLALLFAAPVTATADDAIDAAAKEPGAVVTGSGVVYIPVKQGNGRYPGVSDKVVVNYRGSFADGREFDRGEAVTFPLTGVIPCWTLGIQYIKVGGKGRLVCPASQAYGRRGSPPTIPGNATLLFEVELLDIK